MLDHKNIIVTSGGTREYIDDVRVLTNISTGALGAKITDNLYECGARVHYVHAVGAKMPLIRNVGDIVLHQVSSANDLLEKMKNLILNDKIHAVVHCMAVSDFTFDRSQGAIKCKSDSADDFIEYMRSCIVYNPKIISMIKSWDSSLFLVGFKFEVGASRETLKELAQKSIEKNGCDLIIANDKVEMQTRGSHVGHFFFSKEMIKKDFKDSIVDGKDEIAVTLLKVLDKAL